MNMKRFWKACILFLTLAIFTVLPVQSAGAASNTPGNIKKLTAKAVSDTSVQLTWSAASNATSYTVYRINTENGALKKIGTTSKTTCIVKKLATDTKYTFQVFASRKVKSKTYKNENGSPLASVSLQMLSPAGVKNLRVGSYGNKTIYLKWNAAKNATGDQVYRYSESKGKFVKIKTTSETSYQLKNLTAGEQYKFMVRSYRKVGSKIKYGEDSSTLTAKAKKIDVSSIRGRLFTGTLKRDATATVVSTGKKLKLKKGTRIGTETTGSSGTVTAYTSAGVKIKISGSNLSYGNLYTTTKYYTKAQKEAFVNMKGYDSPTEYLIWVNHYTLNMTIFKGSKGEWKQVRSSPCVVGKYAHTGVGYAKILKKGTKYGRPIIYFTWSTRLDNGNAFHARIDSNTRAAASGGCVRLADADLYFINNNCGIGTTVIRY